MLGPQSQLRTLGTGEGGRAEPLSPRLCSPPVPQQPGGPHFHTVPASGVISQQLSWSRVVQGPPASLLSEREYPDVCIHVCLTDMDTGCSQAGLGLVPWGGKVLDRKLVPPR